MMDKNLFFFATFLKNPKETGSVIPSSRFLVKKMLQGLDLHNARCVVEYGPGTGCITTEILKRSGRNTKVLCFEVNKKFCSYLRNTIKDERLIVINDGAENIKMHLDRLKIAETDYIISSVPFANLPNTKKWAIINETSDVLKSGGKFVTYQYINSLKKFLHGCFPKVSTKFITFNIPPCFVYICGK